MIFPTKHGDLHFVGGFSRMVKRADDSTDVKEKPLQEEKSPAVRLAEAVLSLPYLVVNRIPPHELGELTLLSRQVLRLEGSVADATASATDAGTRAAGPSRARGAAPPGPSLGEDFEQTKGGE